PDTLATLEDENLVVLQLAPSVGRSGLRVARVALARVGPLLHARFSGLRDAVRTGVAVVANRVRAQQAPDARGLQHELGLLRAKPPRLCSDQPSQTLM